MGNLYELKAGEAGDHFSLSYAGPHGGPYSRESGVGFRVHSPGPQTAQRWLRAGRAPEGSKDAAHRFCWAFCVVTDSAPPVFLWVQRGRCPSPQPSLPLRGPAPSLARGRPRQAGLGHRGAATPLRCWQTVITITAGQ